MSAGIYEYHGESHSLRLLESEVPEEELKGVGIGDQPWLSEAAIVIGLSAKLGDAIKYFASQPPQGKRGARYVYMEAGALTQNIHLQATDLGLGCVLVAGFDDSKARQMLSLSSDVEPIALLCIGQRRSD